MASDADSQILTVRGLQYKPESLAMSLMPSVTEDGVGCPKRKVEISLAVYRNERRWLGSLLAIFMLLTILSNIATPLFEMPDEDDHYRFALWLANTNSLPDLNLRGQAGHEAWQTPLYYYLLAPVVRLANGDLPDEIAPRNAGYLAGYSIMTRVHSQAESWPFVGTSLAVHLARLMTSLFGAVTIIATFGLARLVWSRAAWVAAALVAFNPQFIFMSAAISNDVPAACLASLTLFWMMIGLAKKETRWWLFVVLGLLSGLAIMTKLTNLVLGVPILFGLIALHRPIRPHILKLAVHSLLVGVAVFFSAGGWFLLNWQRYGDFLAWQPMLSITSGLLRPQLLSWPATLQYATGLLRSFWMPLGHTQFVSPTVFLIFDGLTLIAGLGLVVWVWRYARKGVGHWGRLGLLFLWSALSLISLLQWMRMIQDTDQGRLLFPAMSGFAILMAVGLTQLRWRGISAAWPAIAGLLVVAILTPFQVVLPAYAQPEYLADEHDLPNPVDIQFGQGIFLRGFQLSSDRVNTPGELNIDLYWQAQSKLDVNDIVRLSLTDQHRTLALVDRMPDNGRYPTVAWQLGRIFRDHYSMKIDSSDASGLANLYLTLYPIDHGDEQLPVHDATADLGTQLKLGTVKLSAAEKQNYLPAKVTDAIFNRQIQLLGFDAPAALSQTDAVTLTLYWQALELPSADYTVFVHLTTANGEIISQADSPPQANQYPTSYWDAGEEVKDVHQLLLPADLKPGEYHLLIGLYRPADGQRLPATRQDGTRWPDDTVSLMNYEMEKP